MDNALEKTINRLIELTEKNMIIELAVNGIPHQKIRKIVGCDMRYITRLLRPIKKDIKRLSKKQSNSKEE